MAGSLAGKHKVYQLLADVTMVSYHSHHYSVFTVAYTQAIPRWSPEGQRHIRFRHSIEGNS